MSSQTIASSASHCLIAFENVLSNHENEEVRQQLARFNFWAANIGVFAPSRASLDARLSSRGGLKYRPLILQLLNVLQKNLHSASRAEAGQAAERNDNDAEDVSYSDSIQAIQDLIDRLHRLSATIRKSAVRDRNLKAANFVERDEEGNDLSIAFENNAIRIIRQRYPDASEALCRRLGESVSLRRKRILYNGRHRAKLANKVPVVPKPEIVPLNVPSIPSPPPGQNIVTRETPSLPQSSGEEIPVAESVRPSETAASIPDSDVQSAVATSRASLASTGSILQDQSLRYPRTPKVDYLTGEASCPYCSAILTEEQLHNPKSWRQHVKQDIEPYICVADSCKSHNTCFDNFKQWVKHVQQEHRVQWHCSMPVHTPISFDDQERFEEHMMREHSKGKVTPSRLSTWAKLASRPALRPFDECPLCKAGSQDIDPVDGPARDPRGPNRLPRHVAGHLKSLALMFLPPVEDDSGDETDGQESSSKIDSARTLNSRDSIFDAPLTFEGDDPAPSTYEEDIESGPSTDWSFLSKPQDFRPEIDPTLQPFVKRAQPRKASLGLRRNRQDWAAFYNLTSDDFRDTTRKEIERQFCLHEIVTSEDDYIDHLSVLQILYRDDLQSSQPPIISSDKLPKFIKSVFGGIDELKLINEVYLRDLLYQKQEMEGPWIRGFSDIFHHWLPAARQAYLNYAAGFPYAYYVVWRERDRNLLFRQFLDQARDNKLSRRLDWNFFLKAPITRLQRYTLLLATVLKNSLEDDTEKAKLSIVTDDLKALCLECDARIDENSKRVELMKLQTKLFLRPGIEKVELNLDTLGRELIFQGDLWRTGANRFSWLETHVILFDHYLILSKIVARPDAATGRKKEIYDVSKLPIPLQLLVLVDTEQAPVIKEGLGSPTKVVHVNDTAGRAVPNNAASVHLQRLPPTSEDPTQGIRYPFSIKHLGRTETYTLFAPTAQNRQDWCNRICEALERHAHALTAQHANPFHLKVLSDHIFRSQEFGSRMGRQIHIKETPLSRALDATDPERSGPQPIQVDHTTIDQGYKGHFLTPILCADTLFHSGRRCLVLGTDNGIYVDTGREWLRVVEMSRVTQIAVVDIPECQMCLFIGNKSLWAIPLGGLINIRPARLRKISGVRDVTFFATTVFDNSLRVFYKQRDISSIRSSSLKTLEAKSSRYISWENGTSSALNRIFGGGDDVSGLFADCGVVDLHRDFTQINMITSPRLEVAVADPAGFTTIAMKTGTVIVTIPKLTSPSAAHVAARIKGQKPLALFQLPNNEVFVCYEECGLYITYFGQFSGGPSRKVIMEFVGSAKSAAMFDSYLVLFNTDFVEIRNIDDGRLRQIIYGEDIRCLDDGNRGANTQGPPRSLKFGMVHPQYDRHYLVLEMVLNEDRAQEQGGALGPTSTSEQEDKRTETLPVANEFRRSKFGLPSYRRSTKDPLDYGPATMEMLLKDAVIKDFLDGEVNSAEESTPTPTNTPPAETAEVKAGLTTDDKIAESGQHDKASSSIETGKGCQRAQSSTWTLPDRAGSTSSGGSQKSYYSWRDK